ncbi:unnamed protein product [Musa acuminata subsp. burmannicoides]
MLDQGPTNSRTRDTSDEGLFAGRWSSSSRRRPHPEVISQYAEEGDPIARIRQVPVSSPVPKRSPRKVAFYPRDEQTRVDGPWKDNPRIPTRSSRRQHVGLTMLTHQS